MFKALLRVNFSALFTRFFSRSAANTRKGGTSRLKTVGFLLLMLYACFAFMTMFGMYFEQLALALFTYGLGWLYFTLYAIAAFALMFLGSVFMVKTQLYEAGDNDLLLAMPIPPGLILAGRMVMLMMLNFVFELIVAVPVLVMWLRVETPTVAQLVSFILLVLALPFLSMAISGLFGWLLALATSRMRKNSLITVLFSLIFLALYFVLVTQANVYIQQLVMNGEAVAGKLAAFSPLYWLGSAVANANILHLLLSLLTLLLPFLVMVLILSATFLQIATAKRGAVRQKYEEKAMRASSVSGALFKRELKRLLSSPVYILNAGLGVIFILIAGVALLIKRSLVLQLIAQLGADGSLISVVIVLGLCLMVSTVLFTAPSVSLEGKTLWIVKSLPVTPQDLLRAKLRLHIYITAPVTVICSAAAAFVFSVSVYDSLIMLVAPFFYVLLSANIGLICNLHNVNLNWVNQTQVIKQSMAVFAAMLLSALVVLLPGGVYLLLFADGAHYVPFMSGYTVLLIVLWRLTQGWILTKGADKFDALG